MRLLSIQSKTKHPKQHAQSCGSVEEEKTQGASELTLSPSNVPSNDQGVFAEARVDFSVHAGANGKPRKRCRSGSSVANRSSLLSPPAKKRELGLAT
jgi:hypothetical protein